MKKYFVLQACMLVSGSMQSMGIPQNPINRENVRDADRIFKDKNIHLNFSFGGHRHEGEYVPLTVESCLKRGFYEGLEQGTANLVAALLIQSATLGIHKGVEWLQRPDEEELRALALQMQIQTLMKGLESNLAKKQQVIAAYGKVVAKLGQNVETAQKIYASQSHSTDEQSPEAKYLEMYTTLSDLTLQSLKEHTVLLSNDVSMLMSTLQAEDEEESR
jgi:hypothetical protein